MHRVSDLCTSQTVGGCHTTISGEDKRSRVKQPLEVWRKDSEENRGRKQEENVFALQNLTKSSLLTEHLVSN